MRNSKNKIRSCFSTQGIKRIAVLLTMVGVSITPFFAQDFSDGPYGTNYYDIAGPFIVPDMNVNLLGDVNQDEIVNVQDIIIVISAILEITELTSEQFIQADLNIDGIVDVLDIVSLVNYVLDPQPPGWDFQSEWNGEDCYIFINYDEAVSNSSALWNSTSRQALLENSPLNVHYFFISNRLQADMDIAGQYNNFEAILENFTPELQSHWQNHLHFITERTNLLDNWINEALEGKYGLGIDRFQQIRQIGYLGNPNGFVGTHMSYLAHEAIYYNFEWDTFSTIEGNVTEVTVFDSVLYSGGWSPTLIADVEIPDDETLSTYTKLEVEAFFACPGYDDDACDDYDRTAKLWVCDEAGENCFEIVRWITPFDRQPHYLTDITSFIAALRPGGIRQFRLNISGWPNQVVFLKLRFYSDGTPEDAPHEIIPLWNGGQFNEDYNDNFEPLLFYVPENATKVEFATYITGHGFACNTGNCAEFCNSGHIFEVNGGVGTFEKTHPEAGLTSACMELDRIAEGVIPNQWGTWGFGRAGWCPGWVVDPFMEDITDYVFTGDQNIISYDGCWIQYASQGCSENWPLPIECNGGYQAEIIMSSYIIIWY